MKPEIVVIGAGSVGANVAYRLAEQGASVIVLEAGAPGGGTSGASFAWLNAFRKTPENYFDLNRASMDEHAALVEELDDQRANPAHSTWSRRHGGLHWEESPEGQAELRANAERLESWGYPVEVITPQAARELEPDLEIAPSVEEVVFTPTEGHVEMVPLIAALLAGARRHGARVLPNRRVTGLTLRDTRVVGVTTEDGAHVPADTVVACAGPTIAAVAKLAEVDLPFDQIPGRLVYTTPVATTLRRVVHAPGVHFRPDGAGRIVLGQENHDADVDFTADEWAPSRYLQRGSAYLPLLLGARVESDRIGVRPMPRDKKPMVGPLPGLDGLYIVVSHSGVTLGPLWGRLAAAELLANRPDPRLEPFRPARFL